VALGSGSTSLAAVGTASTVIGGVTYNFAGATPTSTVSVGAGGAERTITNVAAGRISGSSTDAINGSQLFATNQQVTQNTTDIANFGGAITNIAGDTSSAYTDANGDGIRYARTKETGLTQSDAFAQGVGSTAVGYDALATAESGLALGRAAQSSILGGIALGSGSVSDRAVAPTSGSIVVGTNLVPYNTSDQTLLGALSIGNATSYRQITNVADGTQDQDAVTLRQLKGAMSSFSVTPIQYFHANSTASDSLAVGADSVAIGPRTTVNGDNGVGLGNGAIVQQTAPGGVAIGQNATVNLADGVALGTNSVANGIQALALGAGANASFAGSVALGAGSTTAVGSRTGYAGYGLAAPQNSVGEVSVGGAGSERQITNVAAGSAPTDAVNVSQLNQVAQNTAAALGGGATYDPTTGTYTAPTYTVAGNTYNNVNAALQALNQTAAARNIQANGGPATNVPSNGTLNVTAGSNTVVTLSGMQIAMADNPTFSGVINANGGLAVGQNTTVDMGGNVVRNVGAGAVTATSTDAVNGSQLHQVQQLASNSVQYDAGGNAVTFNPGGQAATLHNVAAGVAPTDAVNVKQLNDGLANAVSTANAYTDSRLQGFVVDMSKARRESFAGTAGALAAAGLPQAYEPGRSMFALGAGTYGGQSAFAMGLSRIMDDGRTILKAGATYDTQERTGANVGVGFQF
jgi:autotransporter adhesin